jgi:5'-nucleotidase
MPYPLENKLVIAVASSALFNLTESDRIFREQGTEAYRAFQRANQHVVLKPGVAFPFIRRLLSLNDYDGEQPLKVILLSRNDPDTGLRVFKSIEAHGLNITQGASLRGRPPTNRIPDSPGACRHSAARRRRSRPSADRRAARAARRRST